MVSCQKDPTRHAYAWHIGTFGQDTLELWKNGPCKYAQKWFFLVFCCDKLLAYLTDILNFVSLSLGKAYIVHDHVPITKSLEILLNDLREPLWWQESK